MFVIHNIYITASMTKQRSVTLCIASDKTGRNALMKLSSRGVACSRGRPISETEEI